MKIEQTIWRPGQGWQSRSPGAIEAAPQLVLVFGSTALMQQSALFGELRAAYPGATLFGCSTAGEIRDTQVSDDSVVATAIHFEHTQVRTGQVEIQSPERSLEVGEELARRLDPRGLRHALVLSDGLGVNGTELVHGLRRGLPDAVTVTGGLSGDGTRFERTLVLLEGEARPGTVGILGLYGERLSVGYGSLGGWDPFGPERLITKSAGNVLFELDGRSALSLYKEYLGDHACARGRENRRWCARSWGSTNRARA